MTIIMLQMYATTLLPSTAWLTDGEMANKRILDVRKFFRGEWLNEPTPMLETRIAVFDPVSMMTDYQVEEWLRSPTANAIQEVLGLGLDRELTRSREFWETQGLVSPGAEDDRSARLNPKAMLEHDLFQGDTTFLFSIYHGHLSTERNADDSTVIQCIDPRAL